MKRLVIEPEKCSGCRYCELVCVFYKEKTLQPTNARINVFYNWEEGLSVPVVCYHCDDAPCIKVCPEKALQRNLKTDAVVIDYEKCIGCRLCTISCPFGGVVYSSVKNKIIKCDLCNGEPMCVKYCSTKAIRFEEQEKYNSAIRKNIADKILSSIGENND